MALLRRGMSTHCADILVACLLLVLVAILEARGQGTQITCNRQDIRYKGINTRLVHDRTGPEVFALFECNDPDKEIRGIGFKVCMHNTWQPEGKNPRCGPESDCTRLPSVQNGVMNGSYPYRHGDTIRLTCNAGYKAVGTEVTRCILRGWSKGNLGKCKKICRIPPLRLPLFSTESKDQLLEGKLIRFRCRGEDHAVIGRQELTCLVNGKLSGGIPRCKRRTCKGCITPSQCQDRTIRALSTKGIQFFPAKVRYFMGEKITARCPSGKRLRPGSASTYMCMPKVPADNGRLLFRKSLGQAPVCEQYGCAPPENANMSIITDARQRSKKLFDPNETVRFTCGVHQIIGSSASRCLRDSWKWSSEWPTCQVRTCDALEIEGAELFYSSGSRQTGSLVTVKCKKCTKAVGSLQSYCTVNRSRAVWHPSLDPTRCSVVTCPAIKRPQNGKMALIVGTVEQQPSCGSEIRFHCPEGQTLVGPESVRCQEDGRWSDCPPICVRRRCSNGIVCGGSGMAECMEIHRTDTDPVQHNCTCLSESACPACPYQQEVCGSNGETYASECHLKVRNCQNDTAHTAVGKRGQGCRFDGICFLPKPAQRPGTSCIGGSLRWYFSSTTGECLVYKRGYCFDGLNSFESLTACRQRCIRVDKCSQKRSRGLCMMLPERRFFFNKHLGVCQQFLYRGCYGTDNNFPDHRTCTNFCVNKELQRSDPCFSKECPNIKMSTACQRDDQPVFAMVADVIGGKTWMSREWTAIPVYIEEFFSFFTISSLVFPATHYVRRHGRTVCDCPDLPAHGKFLIVGTIENGALVVDNSSYVYELRRANAAAIIQKHCPNLIN